jgi:hypothetical protein
MGLAMVATGMLVNHFPAIPFTAVMALLTVAGFFGGLFLIPITAFIQVRPAANDKGRIIAAANFFAFSAMWCSGRLFTFLDRSLTPAKSMVWLGLVALGVAALLLFMVPGLTRARESRVDRSD